MNQSLLTILLATGIFISPCLAGPVGPVDPSCNPTIDTPADGGCTWYNFYLFTDGTVTGGSSFTNYYVAASDPPWTITTTTYTDLLFLDGGHQGDMFEVFDNGSSLGTTSSTPIDATHSCANDTTGEGTDPAACWNDPLMSRGTFLLPPGDNSLTVDWVQEVPGGTSSLQWFEIGAVSTPEPGGLLLTGTGLIAVVGLIRRRRGSRSS